MRARPLGTLLTFSCALFAAPVIADDAPPPNLFSGYVQFMSDYVGRGLAQSLGNPSVGAELDINSGDGLYGNLDGTSINWIDQLYPGDSVDVEIDAVLGYRWIVAPDWTFKAGVLRLQFPGQYVPQSPLTVEPNSTELFGYMAWRGLSARLDYEYTDYFGTADSRGTLYLDLSAAQPVAEAWTLGAHLGRKQERGTDPVSGLSNSRYSYTDYKLSIARSFSEDVSLTLAYTWTNANQALYTLNGYNVGGHHLAVTLEKDF